jgi:hypothetical protein
MHSLIVSAITGHSDPSFTMRGYQHAWEEGVDVATVALGKAFDSVAAFVVRKAPEALGGLCFGVFMQVLAWAARESNPEPTD